MLTVTSHVKTKNYAVDLSAPGKAPQASRAELNYFLRPTRLQPTDGIVRETSQQITKDAKMDVAKARAIYEWIVDGGRFAAPSVTRRIAVRVRAYFLSAPQNLWLTNG